MKKLSDLGERKAIQIISKILSKADIAVEIGDDCAALEFGDDYLLVSTDMIAKDTHISKKMTPWQIGWFVTAVNLSDIAAKGGKPLGVVLSLGLPKSTSESFLRQLMKGAEDCATTFNTSIIGGDTKENQNIVLSGTAFGQVKKTEFMSRKGIKPGDIVAVTGKLGGAGAGYFALKNELKEKKLYKELFEPAPRLKEGMAIAKQKVASSCMDISDGLSSSLYQLSQLNKIGFKIDKNLLPISDSLLSISKKHQDIDVYKYALHFGGDYELLLTIPPDKYVKAKKSMEQIGSILTKIGTATTEKNITLIDNKVEKKLENKGYEHFKSFELD